MSQKRNTALSLVFCTVLAACDSTQPTDPVTPGLPEAADGDLQSLSNSWAAKRSLAPSRIMMSAGAIDGIIYVIGGRHIDPTTNIVRQLARVDAYDVATNT
jgi:hypothetical protein